MHRIEVLLPSLDTRRLISLALLVVGFGTIILYLNCSDSCAGVSGTLAGLDLNLIGIFYLGALTFCILRDWHLPAWWMLASGVGAEVFLIGYQVRTGDYCPFCLTFGGVVIGLFLVNFQAKRFRSLAVAVPLGFLFLLLSFAAAPVVSYGESPSALPVFGTGPTEIRLYTDYFCGPCGRLEPELEEGLVALVESGRAKVVFIDVPMHRPTPLYATCFLAMLKPGVGIREALLDRNLLFAAAKEDLTTPATLQAFLRKMGSDAVCPEQPADFSFYNQLLTEDGIRSTPTLVVYQKGSSETHKGYGNVLKEIERLSKEAEKKSRNS
ncbi:MAG: thioredoxin domain-containing protein [Syntrophotaleaceae bacterium]